MEANWKGSITDFEETHSMSWYVKVVTNTMMEAKVERELKGFVSGVERREMKFDDVWQLYNETSGQPRLLLEMIQRGIVDKAVLREMAMKDLEYSLEGEEKMRREKGKRSPSLRSQATTRPLPRGLGSVVNPLELEGAPSGPPAAEIELEEEMSKRSENLPVADFATASAFFASVNFSRWPTLKDKDLMKRTESRKRGVVYEHEERRSLLKRMGEYSDFLQVVLEIPPSLIAMALNSDLEVAYMSVETLIAEGGRKMAGGELAGRRKGKSNASDVPLLSTHLLRSKALESLDHAALTATVSFGDWLEAADGRWMVDEGILQPADLSFLFARSCLLSLDAVRLLDYWYEWPIKTHGYELGLSQAAMLLLSSLSSQLSSARDTYQRQSLLAHSTSSSQLKQAKIKRDMQLEALEAEKKKNEIQQKQTKSSSSSSSSSHGSKSSSSSHEIPITHVRPDGSTRVTGISSPSPSSPSPSPSPERIAAEFDIEEMAVQEKLDRDLTAAKDALDKAEAHINSAWQSLFAPISLDAHKPSSSAQSPSSNNVNTGPVQLNVNFSLFNNNASGH